MPLATSNFAFTYEDFSKIVYARAFESGLAAKATRLPATEAFSLRRVTTLELSANPAEAATTVETDMKGESERQDLKSFRSQQTVSNELLADSDAMMVVAGLLAREIEEHLNFHCVDAVESISFNAPPVGTYRDNVHSSITNGVCTGAAFFKAAYGQDVTANNLAGGPRFTQEQRGRVVCVMSPTTLELFVQQNPTPNFFLNAPLGGVGGVVSMYGIPIFPMVGGILPNAATSKGGLHVAFVDTGSIIVAEQPLVIRIDTESRAENNQSVIHALYRASAFITNRLNCTGITLRTMA